MKGEGGDIDESLREQILSIINTKILKMGEHSWKKVFSDYALKNGIRAFVLTLLFSLLFFRGIEEYNLCHMHSFYIYTEEEREYAVLDGNCKDYILAECEINDNKLVIDTGEVFVTSAPIKIKKMDFVSVEKKQLEVKKSEEGVESEEKMTSN